MASGAEVDLASTSSWSGNYTGAGGSLVVFEPPIFTDLNLDGATLTFPAGMLEWTVGELAGDFTNFGSMIASGTGNTYLDGTFDQPGIDKDLSAGKWMYKAIRSQRGRGNTTLEGNAFVGGSAYFNNQGTLDKIGAGTATINVGDFNDLEAPINVSAGRSLTAPVV